MPPEYRARIEAMRPQFEAMALAQYGVTLRPGPTGISSRLALIGAKFAEAHGQGEAYHGAIFRAYWQQGERIDDPAGLTDHAVALGLPGRAFAAALSDPVWDAAVQADIDQAHAYGLSGVPALVFAGKYLVSGAQPYPVLCQITERIQGEQAG